MPKGIRGFQKGNKVNLGRKHNIQWKHRASIRMKGNTNGFQRGQPSVFKGKKRPNLSGKNHWNWKNGITPIHIKIRQSLEYKLWEQSILIRDCYTCQKCGKRDSTLVAHHLQNFAQYPELRFAIDNGVTLCRDCHKKFHKIYGKKNNTKEQIEKFLQNSQ